MDMAKVNEVVVRSQKRIRIHNLAAVIVTVGSLLAAVSVAGQTASTKTDTKATSTWKVPRTADGHPDFQGMWSNNSITPLERPTQWAGKQTLSPAEVEDLKRLLAKVDPGGDALFGDGVIQAALNQKQTSYDPTTGNYNQFWIEDRDFDNRTARIIDPPDGRIPALTPEAEARRKARPAGINYKADGPEDRPLSERCITYGVPRTGAGYDSYFQIVQAHDSVAIMQELIHDVRVIPIGTKPHIPPTMRQWLGDPRGYWEGDALVIETTNYRADTSLSGATENLKVIERFTRPSQDYLNWEITYIDPATWTKPWTELVRLKRSDKQVYEYACHEGNYAMADILAGARAQEKATAEATAPKASQ
jgi:hypothetical protein